MEGTPMRQYLPHLSIRHDAFPPGVLPQQLPFLLHP